MAQYHNQAGLIDIKNLNSSRINDFEFLTPIADRIKDVVVLGGEPFYDKACLKFLSWAKQNLTSNILLFTNGSMIDFDFLCSFQGKLTIIFSLDAVGCAAEYVRVGTIWSDVLSNFEKVKKLSNVETRVNITCSVYNYWHLEKLIELLCKDWPAVVSFGQPNPDWYRETVIPMNLRSPLIESLERTCLQIQNTDIESGQKSNAVNAIQSIINNLQKDNFNKKNYDTFCDFVKRMDRVKGLNADDYCNFLGKLLQQEIT